MKRRDVLKYGVGCTGIALWSGIGRGADIIPRSVEPAAGIPDEHLHVEEDDDVFDPDVPEVVTHRFREGRNQVEVVRRGRKARMRIDGRVLPKHYFSEVDGRYGSHLLPFRDFTNPRDLAKELIDNNGTLFRF